jgi:hypothetical protein
MKNTMGCYAVSLVSTDVSEERIASVIRVTRIGDLGTLAITNNRSTQRYISPKRRFL